MTGYVDELFCVSLSPGTGCDLDLTTFVFCANWTIWPRFRKTHRLRSPALMRSIVCVFDDRARALLDRQRHLDPHLLRVARVLDGDLEARSAVATIVLSSRVCSTWPLGSAPSATRRCRAGRSACRRSRRRGSGRDRRHRARRRQVRGREETRVRAPPRPSMPSCRSVATVGTRKRSSQITSLATKPPHLRRQSSPASSRSAFCADAVCRNASWSRRSPTARSSSASTACRCSSRSGPGGDSSRALRHALLLLLGQLVEPALELLLADPGRRQQRVQLPPDLLGVLRDLADVGHVVAVRVALAVAAAALDPEDEQDDDEDRRTRSGRRAG